MNNILNNSYKGQRVTVMGLGHFGGGIGAARYFARRGATVTVTDMKDSDALAESIEQLNGLPIRYVLGEHKMEDFTSADIVIVSPAVPRDSEFIAVAKYAKRRVTTEIGLFIDLCPPPICGVTGSNGKTTTVSMIASIMRQADRPVWAGGNIGGSLLDSVDDITEHDAVVIELSSFQLEWLRDMRWSPKTAAILNITPNHLDRHSSFDEYRNAKMAILEFQKTWYNAVLVYDDPEVRALSGHVRSQLTWVGLAHDRGGMTLDNDGWIISKARHYFERVFDTKQLKVPGKHNILNAMAAAACSSNMGARLHEIRAGLSEFRGIPHRIEFVREQNGIRFFNDSKATTPESTVAAVTSFQGTVLPILGGYDKGVSFDSMASALSGNIKWAALIGTTAPAIGKALEAHGISSTPFGSLEGAVDGCVKRAKSGDVVLLSPGCASYDMFPNYEARGDTFKTCVSGLAL